jgi:ribonuclease D
MSSDEMKHWIWIDTVESFHALVNELHTYTSLAVDTESNSLHAYHERICLIQISTIHSDYLLDPLAVRDLAPLESIFAAPHIEKVFHAAEYDLICLRRDFGWKVTGIFDTMIAARTLGWTQLGLGSLLETHFGVKADKRHQRANWGMRPLTTDQLVYAQLDTHYLLPLRDHIVQELKLKNCYEEAQEEFDRLSQFIGNNHFDLPAFDPENFWRISGARDLTPRQAALLRELFIYRDTIARQVNRPPFKVMNDSVLLALAQAEPATLDQVKKTPGVSGSIQRHARALLEAVERGRRAPPCHPPRNEREPDEIVERYETLRKWRKKKAEMRGVEADVIIPRDVMWSLARRPPHTRDDLQFINGLGPIRREKYGEEIVAILQQSQVS